MNDLSEKLHIAQQLANRGFGLFLLKPKSKLPLETGWQQQVTNHFETFRTRLETYPNCNIGVATGRKWGLWVLDIDPRHGGNDALMRLEKANGLLPETFVVQTGGGGLHYYFAAPVDVEVKNSAGIIGDGIDTRGDGGYVVGAGSEHESGRVYAILSSPCDLALPPDWLLKQLTQRKAKSKTSVVPFEEGSRNTDLCSLAGSLRRKGLDEQQIDAALQALNSTTANPLDPSEVNSIARSVGQYAVPTAEDFTERALANAFAKISKTQIARISEGGWAYYKEGSWHIDPSGSSALICQELVKSFMERIDTEVRQRTLQCDGEEADKLIKAASKCQSATKIANVMRLTASDPALMVSMAAFDEDANLLNLKNGVLNLETGELLPHDPKYRLMKQANVNFDPAAKSPVFDRFLADILEPETGEFIMRAFAYSLLGRADKQLAFVLLGSGLNGKTTLANAITGLVGTYATVIDPSSLLQRESPSVRNDIARLCGTRTVFTSEFAKGSHIDAPLLKRLTGNEVMTARFLYREEFEFFCRGVFFLTTNHAPVIDGSDFALARRLCVIPFDRRIAKDQVDPGLDGKLASERSGILNRLLSGLRRYRSEGLNFPQAVGEATDKYISESDLIGEFLRECCEDGPRFKVSANDLNDRYMTYCMVRGAKRISAQELRRALESKGYRSKRTAVANVWEGMKLVPYGAWVAESATIAGNCVGSVGQTRTIQ